MRVFCFFLNNSKTVEAGYLSDGEVNPITKALEFYSIG